MRRSSVPNTAVIDPPILDGHDRDAESAYSVRGGILFTQAAIVLMAGLLLPIPPVAIDVLLSVNLVFTAMLLFVVVFAREPAEIASVPLVVIFVTLLRLGTNVAAAKSILLTANGGRIIDWLGTHIYYGFVSVAVAVLLVFMVCALVCRAAGFIRSKAVSYLVDTIPNRRTSLQAEFGAGILTYDQMLRAKNRVEKQAKFFSGMAGTSSLLLCDGVIALIITLATIIGATALGIMNASSAMSGSPQYSPLSLAIALTTAVPAGLVALSLRLLVSKRFLITLKVQSPMAQIIHVASRPVVKDAAPVAPVYIAYSSRKIATPVPLLDEEQDTDIDDIGGTIEEAERKRDDVLTTAVWAEETAVEELQPAVMPEEPRDMDTSVSEFPDADEMQPEPQAEIALPEQQSALSQTQHEDYSAVMEPQESETLEIQEAPLVPEAEPDDYSAVTQPRDSETLEIQTPAPPQTQYEDYSEIAQPQEPETLEIQEQPSLPQIVRDDYYYDSILATIGDRRKASILLAGQSVSELPVTVAVELVVRIVQLRKKCLLIDMDQRRNAVATAFDIDSSSMQGKAVPTGIDHLWISPADDPENPAAVKLSRKVTNALRIFNYVVIYAPDVTAEGIPQQLVGVPDAAVVFGANESSDSLLQFAQSLASSGCHVVPEHDFLRSHSASQQ
jgi:hypothetical protein